VVKWAKKFFVCFGNRTSKTVFIFDGGTNMMEVIIVKSNKKDFLDLLILADEQESMIDKYLEQGELFAS
jgi:hypothetical protein